MSRIIGVDIEINKLYGQLALLEHASDGDRISISGADKELLDKTDLSQELKNLLLSFSGAEIDFVTGSIYEEDGTTPLGIDFTPVVIAASQYRWYSVTLVASTVNADNSISGQLVVLAGSADGATPDLAPKPAFANGKKLGMIAIEGTGGGIQPIIQDNIRQLGVAGSGGGEGNADELIERLRNQIDFNNYGYVGYNIFRLDEDDKVDVASTGAFDIANGVYDVDTGQTMVSIQMLDAMFLNPSAFPDTADEDAQDVPDVELTVFWNPEEVDDAATYEVSRMAGQATTFQTIEMDRIGNTDTYRGRLTFEDESVADTLDSYVAGSLGVTDFEGVAANANISNATAFTLADTAVVNNFKFHYDKLGSPLGNYKVSIIRDDGGGLPSTDPSDVLSDSNLQDVTALASGSNVEDVAMPSVTLEPDTYHVVVSTDLGYKTSYVDGVNELRVEVDTAGGNIDLSQLDGTTGTWAALVGVSMRYELEGRVLDLRVRITSSQDSSLAGYGVFYDGSSGYVTGVRNADMAEFDGIIDNENEFTLGFLPDPDLLRVYEVDTGQVYINGAFNLDGNKVTFPADTFNKVGTIKLIFDQTFGASFDNADNNAALMAANRLGSTDPAIDRSIAGEGILLRATNGTLVEASLEWTGAAYQWVFSEV